MNVEAEGRVNAIRQKTLFIAFTIWLVGCASVPSPHSGPTPAAPPGVLPAQPYSQATLFDEYVKRAGEFGFSGVVLATRGEQRVIEQAAGLRDISAGKPNTISTLFNIGSLSKQFTAAAILALEEDGALSTSDPLTHFFPDVPDRLKPITIQQLLTHSAGLPWDITEPGVPLDKRSFWKRLGSVELQSSPGERFGYSNLGYVLLAAIVEKASGNEFDAFVRERLFARAALTATGYLTEAFDDHPAARGYLAGQDRGFPWQDPDNVDGGPTWRVIGAGRMVSHAEDIERWGRALISGRVLSEASLAKLFGCQIRIENGDAECYGYGWNVDTEDGRRLIWHDGSTGSFWARLSIYPEEGLQVAVLSNKSLQAGWIVDANVRQALTGQGNLELPPASQPLIDGDRSRLKGRYVVSGAEIEILQVGDDLLLEPKNEQALTLVVPVHKSEAARAATLSRTARRILDSASNSDYSPLRAAASDGAFEELKETFEALRELGSRAKGFVRFGIIGTARGPTGPAAPLATYAFARFGGGDAPIRLVWQGEKLQSVIMQTAAFVNPPRLVIQRELNGGYVGHNLALRRTMRLRFDEGNIQLDVDGLPRTGVPVMKSEQ